MRKKILLTGATGFLGSYCLSYLLAHTNAQIYCIARRKGKFSAEARVLQKLRKNLGGPLAGDPKFIVNLELEKGRITVLEGDIRYPDLKLSPPFPGSARLDEVWHTAAQLDFAEFRERQTFEANLQGTRNVLDWMHEHGSPFLNHVSTAYVCGTRGSVIPENAVDESFPANNPYERSKRAAEKAILEDHQKYGTRFRIFRPSVIVGHSQTFASDSSSGLYAYLAVLLRFKDAIERRMPEYFKVTPLKLLFGNDVTLNLIFVDHAVDTMFKVAATPQSINQIIHITNPHPVSLRSLIGKISEVVGTDLRNVTDVEKLNPIDSVLHAQTDIYGAYLKNNKQFECNKMLRFSKTPPEAFLLPDSSQKSLIHKMYQLHQDDQRTQKMRLKNVFGRLERRVMERSGVSPLGYYIGGRGKSTLVLLNAFGQSLAFWDSLIHDLFNQHRMIIWQARGTKSQEGGVSCVYSIQEHVKDMRAILDRESVSICSVLGWCTGPKLAFAFNRSVPGRISSIISLSGCFKNLGGSERLYTEYEVQMEKLCRMIDEEPPVAESLMPLLKSALTSRAELEYDGKAQDAHGLAKSVLRVVSDDVRPLIIEPFLSPASVVSYARQLLSFWECDVSATLQQTRIPVLLIAGEMDNVASSAMSRKASSLIPCSHFAEVKGGSHYMHYDNSRLICDMAGAFLNGPMNFGFSHGLVTLTPSGHPQELTATANAYVHG